MKRTLTIAIILLTGTVSMNGQTLTQINKKLDSLYTLRKNLQSKIQTMQDQLSSIKQQTDALESQKSALMTSGSQTPAGTIVAKTMAGGGILRDSPNSTGNTLATIPAGETIYVHREQQNLYFKVSYKSHTGYLSYSTISQNQEIDDFLAGKNPVNTSTTTTTIVRGVDENDPKYQKLLKLYGKEKAVKIVNGELFAGMSGGMVLEAIGKPNSKTTTPSVSGSIETWVYNDRILEFVNGELKSWNKK
jgi:hypothetical protein